MLRLGRSLILAGSLVTSTVIALVMVACGSSSSDGSNGTGPSLDNGGSGPGINGTGGGSGSGTTSAAPASSTSNCGASTNSLTKKPADLLLVLDRSSSMTRALDSADNCSATSTTCSQRWTTMISSLNTVLSTASTDVLWGLKFFTTPTTGGRGGGGSCNLSAGVEVPIAANDAATIQAQIQAAGTANSTPTRLALEAAVTYLRNVADTNPKYILLATDGEPNCAPGASSTSASDLPATITAAQNAAAAGYKVFVIGVGPEAANLTSIAQAGGTDHFYPATTPAELTAALASIVGTVAAGCTYPVGATKVSDPNAIGVYVDKALVPQSATDGWSIDAANTTITFNGTYCADLKSGTKQQVQIYLPCAGTSPPVIPTTLQ